MLKRFWHFFYKRKPTSRELDWKERFTIGSDVKYLGVTGILVYNHDLYTSKLGGDDWEGEAFITLRYVDNNGRFGEIDLNESDIYGDTEEV